MATVKIVAFNGDGYKKTIAAFDTTQIRSHDGRVSVSTLNIVNAWEMMPRKSTPIGVSIEPEAFPEMTSFVVLVEE